MPTHLSLPVLLYVTILHRKYHKYNNSSCSCGANVYNNIIDCEDDYSIVHLQSCHCMSYMDNSDDDAVVMGTSKKDTVSFRALDHNLFYSTVLLVTHDH